MKNTTVGNIRDLKPLIEDYLVSDKGFSKGKVEKIVLKEDCLDFHLRAEDTFRQREHSWEYDGNATCVLSCTELGDVWYKINDRFPNKPIRELQYLMEKTATLVEADLSESFSKSFVEDLVKKREDIKGMILHNG